MALLDYVPERHAVIVKGQPLFQVEGLSLETLAVLVRTHMPDFDAIFDLITKGEGQVDEDLMAQLGRIAINIASQAPGLTANIIAVCADEETTEELVAAARRLPFPVQVEALFQIGTLTFDEVGDVKKSMERLMNLLMRLRTRPSKSEQTQATPKKPTSADSISA